MSEATVMRRLSDPALAQVNQMPARLRLARASQVAWLNVPVYEVAISYYGRTYAEGKKINWKDGLWALWCIVKYGLFHRPGKVSQSAARDASQDTRRSNFVDETS